MAGADTSRGTEGAGFAKSSGALTLALIGLLQLFVGPSTGLLRRVVATILAFVAAGLLVAYSSRSRASPGLAAAGVIILVLAGAVLWIPASASIERIAGAASPGQIVYFGKATDSSGRGIHGLWIYEGDFLNPDPVFNKVDGWHGKVLTRTASDGTFRIKCPNGKKVLIASMDRFETAPADPDLNWAWRLADGGSDPARCQSGERSDPVVTVMEPGAILKGRYIWDSSQPGVVRSGNTGFGLSVPGSDHISFQMMVVRSTYIYTGLRAGTYSLSDNLGGEAEVHLEAGQTKVRDWYSGVGFKG